MAVRATIATRAPRGTKQLTQAFFAAAEGIPEGQRETVIKAALAGIRDRLKEDRDQMKAAKAKAKAKAKPGKSAPTARAKPAAPAPAKRAAAPPAKKASPKKSSAQPSAKSAPPVEHDDEEDMD